MPAELRVLFLVSYAFLIIVISMLLGGSGVGYLSFLLRYYPRCLEDVLRKKRRRNSPCTSISFFFYSRFMFIGYGNL